MRPLTPDQAVRAAWDAYTKRITQALKFSIDDQQCEKRKWEELAQDAFAEGEYLEAEKWVHWATYTDGMLEAYTTLLGWVNATTLTPPTITDLEGGENNDTSNSRSS
ncbi:hypothetical protein ACX3T3_03875 [Actinotignum schaalii]|uniref:hypothetical protein n=1 Tax=Actinotignum TaxID=1653174 RepID=UPI00237DD575|nr:hypothetical protein [Actinotignum sanguinis]MDE1552247.1 hypothetical protein [Actinotignum sanguinis]